ncbi:hypothetical protein SLS62_006119 [Diatrype stigma]|uniref:Major facilitator superfamily (MFS) profile domain-containing protein n=1 Tax=Diatrype stigma TaxID=117547 RepID=A0AAN9UQ34_9PEZI
MNNAGKFARMPEGEKKLEDIGTKTASASRFSSEPSSDVPEEGLQRIPDDDDQLAERRAHLHWKTFLAVFAVLLIYFAQLVSLIGAGAQGQTIAAHFGSPTSVVWFTGPITILTVVLGPIFSHAADYWGRKWFLIVPTVLGGVGSIIVSRAQSIGVCILGFTVIGVAFGSQPLLHTVTSEVLPRRWRGYGQAADMVSNCTGSIFGLLVGGALNRTNDPASDGFRYYFYITMAIYFAAAAICFFAYNPPQTELQHRLGFGEKLAKLDWIGYALLASGLVLFCVALSFINNPFDFGEPHVAATFAVGLSLALALVAYETFWKKDGMFHHGLFTGNRNFAVSLFCVFSEGIAFFAANNYFAFQVSVLYETDAVVVGTRYTIMLVSASVGAVATGWYCAIYKKVRWATVLAFVIFTAFFACMATSNLETDRLVWGYPVLMGIALGMTLTTLVTVAQLSTPPELISIASGLIISVRSLGGTIGIAIYNALFNDAMSIIGTNISNAAAPKGLSPGDMDVFISAVKNHNDTMLASIPGITPEAVQAGNTAILNTYVQAFQNVWIAAACFVALASISRSTHPLLRLGSTALMLFGILVATFLLDPKQEFNDHIDAPVEESTRLYEKA